ncbi:MAG: PspC domain-containing protein [Bacteroidales bacterium]|nr:PspC domain-containing protein [Bacteroidales bacterium]
MKKTVTININGIIFNIDEDAYEKLQNYLVSINNRFSNTEEGREIILDIEARIGELFQEKVTDGKQVISIEDVERIIEIMGNPEDFSEEEEDKTEEDVLKDKYYYRRHRKFYRDPDNKVFGGVCSGLAAYFNIDPVILRIITIVLFIFAIPFTLITYIILWIVIPEAITTAQKLEMRGEKVTVSNIEKTIKEEVQNVKENFQKIKKSKTYDRTRETTNQVINVLGDIVRIAFKIVLIIIGIAFIIAGISMILSLLGAFIFSGFYFSPTFLDLHHMIYIPDFMNLFVNAESITLFSISLFLLIIIPVIAILYGGLKLVFRFKANDKAFWLTSLFAWILSLMILISLSFIELKNYSTKGKNKEIHIIENTVSEVLYIDINNSDFNENDDTYIVEEDDFIILSDENNSKIFIRPKFDIIKNSNIDNIQLIIKKEARGKNKREASKNAERIIYNWVQQDSVLKLDPYFTLPEGEKWNAPGIELILKLPEGKSVFLSEDMEDIIYDIDNIENIWDGHMGGKKWIMKPNGLSRCKH